METLWKKKRWILPYLIIFILTLDFWNWGKTHPLIYGIPYWVIPLFAVTLILSLYYIWIMKYVWVD